MAVVLAMAGGCSDNETPVDTTDYSAAFYGKWQVTDGSADIRYMLFQAERTWYILGEDSNGFRGLATGAFLADESVISFGSRLYFYTLSADQVTLLNSADTITMVRNPNAPGSALWLGTAALTDSISSPVNQGSDLTADSTSLWIGNGLSPTPRLFRVHTDTRTVDTLAAALLVNAAEWDGAALWCSSPFTNQLTRIDPVTGAILASSAPIATNIFGLAWDGQRLWAGSQSSLSLSVYDPLTSTIVQTVPGVYGDGMAFAGGFLYLCKDGVVHKCTTSPFRAVSSYAIPAGRAAGIAYDGTAFWISAATGPGPQYVYKIYRAVL